MFALERTAEQHADVRADPPEVEHWDLVISSHRRLLRLHLDELWQYRDLLKLFVRRDIVAFYKQTILGPIWVLLQPLLTSLIYLLVFHRIAGLSTDGLPPIVFYLAGVSCWTFFSESFVKTSETFLTNAPLFEKVYFPRLVIPISIVVSSLIRLVIQLGLFFLLWTWYVGAGLIQPGWALLLLPLPVFLAACIALGLGLMFSSLTAKYRDLRFLLQFGIQLLMFATPVIYPLSIASDTLQRLMLLNPLTSLFETFRYASLGVGRISIPGLAWSTFLAAAVLAIGIVVFHRTERTFIDTV